MPSSDRPTFQGVYAPRSELETRQPFACVARQAVRRLVSLGFNLDNLKNSFRADPNYEIPANVFLQDMTQVSLSYFSIVMLRPPSWPFDQF